MPRVIAGRLKGLRLVSPAGLTTRPTADRVKEALFSILISLPFELKGARVLDFFAGSGALALEALSRGASSAVLADQDPRAMAALRRNLAAAGRIGGLEAKALQAIWPRDWRLLTAEDPFDLFLLDPPYDCSRLPLALLQAAAAEGLAAPAAVAVWEQSPANLELWNENDAPAWRPLKTRAWGRRAAAFFRLKP